MTHPPAPVQSVEEIVETLTKAQRDLLDAYVWSVTVSVTGSFVGGGDMRTERALVRRSLIQYVTVTRVTDLGHAVAAALRGGSE